MGRVERQTIQVAIESVYDLRMHACLCVAFTTGKMYLVRRMVAQASCAVGGVITVTKNYCCSGSCTPIIRVTR